MILEVPKHAQLMPNLVLTINESTKRHPGVGVLNLMQVIHCTVCSSLDVSKSSLGSAIRLDKISL